MYPVIFGQPSVFVFWGLASLLGSLLAVLFARQENFPPRQSFPLLLVIGLVFLLGTKVHAWIASPFPIAHEGWWRALQVGFHFPGGLIAIALVSPLIFRWSSFSGLRFMDAIVPAIGFAIAIARIGCFLNGCCYGVACDLPWGVEFPRGSRAFASLFGSEWVVTHLHQTVPLHPLQLYFAIGGLLIGLALLWFRKRRRFQGQSVLLFVVLWAWLKVAVESLRDPSFMPVTPHLLEFGLGIAVIATGLWFFLLRKTRPQSS